MLNTGDVAPAIELPDTDMNLRSLAEFAGSWVVVYFYPKDDTPGCTIEANQFTSLVDEFEKADTVVLGVSKDSCASHQAFIDKFGLKLDLLADTDGKLCDSYGVWQEKEKDGVKKMGIVRSTFIIDRHGKLVDVEYGVNPQGHAQAVLDKVRKL